MHTSEANKYPLPLILIADPIGARDKWSPSIDHRQPTRDTDNQEYECITEIPTTNFCGLLTTVNTNDFQPTGIRLPKLQSTHSPGEPIR